MTPHPPRRLLRDSATVYSILLALVGAGALILVRSSIPWHDWPTLLALLALAVVARRLEFTVGKLAGVSFDTSIHFAAVALVGPGGAALVAGLAALIGLLSTPATRTAPWSIRFIRLARNGGMFALMQLGSGAMYVALGGARTVYPLWAWQLWALALVWIAVYHLINALVGYPVYLLGGRVTWRSVLTQDPAVFMAELATLPAGVLLLAMHRAEGLAGLVLLGVGLVTVSALVQRLANTTRRLGTQLKAADTLNQVGQALSMSLDTDEILELVSQHVTQVMSARTLSIALYDREQQMIHYPVIIEENKRYPPQSLPFEPGNGLTPYILVTHKPLRLNTLEEMNRMSVRHIITGTGRQMQSYLGAPMVARGNALGVLSVQSPLPHAFTEDDLHTLATLAQQAAISIDNSRLVLELAARERMKQELEIARRTQLSLLPPCVPPAPGLDIAGDSQPAAEVGGDFYSYHTLGNRLGIAVGDVSGKGMPAALLMALSAGILQAEASRAISSARMLASVDQALRPHAARSRANVGCCYVMVNLDGEPTPANQSFLFNIASAGMPSPLARYASGQTAWLDACGLPLGVPGVQADYAEVEQKLERGDALILTSDGIVEAMNARGEMFGFERFEAAVAAAPLRESAQAALDFVLEQMHTFVGSCAPHDDVTLVIIRVL